MDNYRQILLNKQTEGCEIWQDVCCCVYWLVWYAAFAHAGLYPRRPKYRSIRCHPAVSVTYLYFSESNSYFKRVQGYEFRAGGNHYTAYFYMANEDELYPVQVDQAWADTLSGFVSQYDMVSWNGFSGHDSMLMDGTQFSIDFTLADGTRIQAAGYGEFPDGYGGASSAIDAHFMQLLPEDMRDW